MAREVMGDSPVGTAGWDIGMILTRHAPACAKVHVLRETVPAPSHERLAASRKVACNCGTGISDLEETCAAA